MRTLKPLALLILIASLITSAQATQKNASEDEAIYQQSVEPFTRLLGTADHARRHLTRLRSMANNSPYDFQTFAHLSQHLLIARIAEQRDFDILLASSLAAKALGDDAESFNRIALTLADLQRRNLSASLGAAALINMSLPVYKIAAEELRMSESKTRRLIETDRMRSDDLATLLIAGFIQDYR